MILNLLSAILPKKYEIVKRYKITTNCLSISYTFYFSLLKAANNSAIDYYISDGDGISTKNVMKIDDYTNFNCIDYSILLADELFDSTNYSEIWKNDKKITIVSY